LALDCSIGGRRIAEKRDEFAPPDHSITGGTVRPSALAGLVFNAHIMPAPRNLSWDARHRKSNPRRDEPGGGRKVLVDRADTTISDNGHG
jgi:hypothetical protein